jgi:hypothetical protein
MTRIGEHHPRLGEHLSRTIRTGLCGYLPTLAHPRGFNPIILTLRRNDLDGPKSQ